MNGPTFLVAVCPDLRLTEAYRKFFRMMGIPHFPSKKSLWSIEPGGAGLPTIESHVSPMIQNFRPPIIVLAGHDNCRAHGEKVWFDKVVAEFCEPWRTRNDEPPYEPVIVPAWFYRVQDDAWELHPNDAEIATIVQAIVWANCAKNHCARANQLVPLGRHFYGVDWFGRHEINHGAIAQVLRGLVLESKIVQSKKTYHHSACSHAVG